MLGGFFVFFLFAGAHITPFLAVPIAVLAAAAIAAGIQRSTLAILQRRDGWLFATIAATLGISIILQNVALLLWGERFQSVPYYIEGTLAVGDIRMAYQRLLILAVALCSLALVGLVLRYTRFGLAVRATAQDQEAAKVMGISTERINTATFAMGAGLAALAATMLAPLIAVNPWMGLPLLLKAFVVVVLGGLGSFKGAILGGILLGVIEAVGMSMTSAEWRDVISYSVLIAVIWLRPWGLFGVKER
jgi:branched-chain amino acid transport system permease protein